MIFKRLFVSLFVAFNLMIPAVALVPAPAYAADATGTCGGSNSSFLGLPTWYKYLKVQKTDNGCDIQFDIAKDIGKILLAVFEIILRVGGLVAVGFVIYGGFKYLVSQGEPDAINKAKTTVLNAVIGLVIMLASTGIVNLIGRNIG